MTTKRTCDAEPCGRKATHLAIDDDNEVLYFCPRCAKNFEGGMQEVRPLREEDDT